MARKVRSVSITDEQDKWLEENLDTSLSEITQFAIENQIRVQNSGHVREIKDNLERAMNRIKEMCAFLESKDLLDEYLKGEKI